MDHAHDDVRLVGREAREIGFGADDREGARVDRGAVAQIWSGLSHDFGFGRRSTTICPSRRASWKDSHDPAGAPSTKRSHAPSRPIAASVATTWYAQPLAQPEIWIVSSRFMSSIASRATAGASDLASISPDAQI